MKTTRSSETKHSGVKLMMNSVSLSSWVVLWLGWYLVGWLKGFAVLWLLIHCTVYKLFISYFKHLYKFFSEAICLVQIHLPKGISQWWMKWQNSVLILSWEGFLENEFLVCLASDGKKTPCFHAALLNSENVFLVLVSSMRNKKGYTMEINVYKLTYNDNVSFISNPVWTMDCI